LKGGNGGINEKRALLRASMQGPVHPASVAPSPGHFSFNRSSKPIEIRSACIVLAMKGRAAFEGIPGSARTRLSSIASFHRTDVSYASSYPFDAGALLPFFCEFAPLFQDVGTPH